MERELWYVLAVPAVAVCFFCKQRERKQEPCYIYVIFFIAFFLQKCPVRLEYLMI